MDVIEIRKRNSEEVACWRVDASRLTPNTVIELESGLMVMLKVDGVQKMLSRGKSTVFGVFNPGKEKKLIGGNKVYEKAEIVALDLSSEFTAEWGLAGEMAVPCFDKELNIPATAVAFGEYAYKIENQYDFLNAFSFDDEGEIKRDSIREFLRTETASIAKAQLSAALSGCDIRDCQAKLPESASKIREALNRRLINKGIVVHSFVISQLRYAKDHQLKRVDLENANVEYATKAAINRGRLDDVNVDSAAADVDVKLIDAIGRANNGGGKGDKVKVCPRCKEPNPVNANYCHKCNFEFNGKNKD